KHMPAIVPFDASQYEPERNRSSDYMQPLTTGSTDSASLPPISLLLDSFQHPHRLCFRFAIYLTHHDITLLRVTHFPPYGHQLPPLTIGSLRPPLSPLESDRRTYTGEKPH